MPFSYSIVDFIAGANLSYQLIQALSCAHCPSEEYQEALVELGCLQQTFLQVGRMTSNPNLSPATVNAASHIVMSSMTLIENFLATTKKYRKRVGSQASGNPISDSWQKIGWVLFKKDELKALKDALHGKLVNISLLLETARYYEGMPISGVTTAQPSGTKQLGDHELFPSSSTNMEPNNAQVLDAAKISVAPRNLSTVQRDEGSGEAAVEHELSNSGWAHLPALEKQVSLLAQPYSSNRIVDITPKIAMDQATCRDMVSSYEVYTIRKAIPDDPKKRSTWARAEIFEVPFTQEDILRGVKRLNETSRRSAAEKQASLMQFQQGQCTRLLDELNAKETNTSFEWSIVQLDQKIRTIKTGQKETTTITLFLKRAPRKDVDVLALFNELKIGNVGDQ